MMLPLVRVACWACVWCALACVCVAGQPTYTAELKAKRLLDCTLEATKIGDCDIVGYGIRVGSFSCVGLLVSVCLLLVCPLYCMSKYCCNCCGGRRQAPGCCCPNDDLPAVYSKGDIIRAKLWVLLSLLLVAVGLILGYVAAKDTVNAVKSVNDAIKGVPDVLTDEINKIDERLKLTRYHENGTTTTERLFETTGKVVKQEAEKARDTVKKQITDMLSSFEKYVDRSKVYLWGMFAFPVVLVIVAVLGSLCNCRSFLPMTIVWFLFLSGVVMWLAHSGTSIVSYVLADTCAELNGVSKNQQNLISVLAKCKDSQFQTFREKFNTLETEQAKAVCEKLMETCAPPSLTPTSVSGGKIFDCGPLSCTGATFASLVKQMETSIKIHASVIGAPGGIFDVWKPFCSSGNEAQCTVARCSKECIRNNVLTILGKKAKVSYVGLQSLQTLSATVDTLGAEYSTCDGVFQKVVRPFVQPCDSTVNAFRKSLQATGISGLGCLMGLIATAQGAKRWVSLDDAGVPLGDAEY